VVAVGAYLGLAVVHGAFAERIQSIADDANYTLRVAPLDRLTDALQEPLIGGGLGTASPGASRVDLGFINGAESFGAALVFQVGIPGGLLFCVFVFALLRAGYVATSKCRPNDFGVLAAAILVYELAVCLDSWSYDPLHYPPSRVIFWFWAGVLLSLPDLARRNEAVASSSGRCHLAQAPRDRFHVSQMARTSLGLEM
jgi:hypothetical protein